jgi:hypothetical protein
VPPFAGSQKKMIARKKFCDYPLKDAKHVQARSASAVWTFRKGGAGAISLFFPPLYFLLAS